MLRGIVIGLLNTYQRHVRIFLPYSCRFMPSCSEYAKLAVIKYGLLKGGYKGLKRVLRCHPFSRHFGYDPVI